MFDQNNPAVQQTIQYIAAGVLQVLQQRMPGGIPNPTQPHTVLRTGDDGIQRQVQTNLIQQLAELNDNLKDLTSATYDVLEEAEERQHKRKRRRDDF